MQPFAAEALGHVATNADGQILFVWGKTQADSATRGTLPRS